ncbi:MAG: CheR family methyltransferase, partial [Negativicutes bacterium]|nr:CheR family methyltransferase [Negativicutes bacterium]
MKENNSGTKTRGRRPAKQLSAVAAKAAGFALIAGAGDKPPQRQDCPVVGIGASAGGLQALLQLFEGLPATSGLAFVVIQHLDANNDSALADILSRSTAMPVSAVKDSAVVLPDHVYVISPGTGLILFRGVLAATPQKGGVRRHMPIDSFFESLAQDKAGKAFGVVLSGNGADGAQGLKEIKDVGGITFAQTPQSAEYDGMPRSAIATGMVDFIGLPAEIAAELSRIGRSLMLTGLGAEGAELFPDGTEALNRLVGLLRKASGINFAEYKQLTIKRRIARRMLLHKIDKLDDYVDFLGRHSTELAALQQDLLINVTKFFREPEAFDFLKKEAFPAIVRNTAPTASIRLWVPGCSTGEEAYSLAIALLEYLEENPVNRRVQIFATDINETVIDKARAGIYPKTIVADISPARLSRFFIEVDQGYQVSKTIRDICVFARQDIGQDPPISRVDLISCRNVMIYFGPALHKRIFPIFHYALSPGGFLLLGASESIGVFSDLFHLVDKKHRIYTKKSVTTPVVF